MLHTHKIGRYFYSDSNTSWAIRQERQLLELLHPHCKAFFTLYLPQTLQLGTNGTETPRFGQRRFSELQMRIKRRAETLDLGVRVKM